MKWNWQTSSCRAAVIFVGVTRCVFSRLCGRTTVVTASYATTTNDHSHQAAQTFDVHVLLTCQYSVLRLCYITIRLLLLYSSSIVRFAQVATHCLQWYVIVLIVLMELLLDCWFCLVVTFGCFCYLFHFVSVQFVSLVVDIARYTSLVIDIARYTSLVVDSARYTSLVIDSARYVSLVVDSAPGIFLDRPPP